MLAIEKRVILITARTEAEEVIFISKITAFIFAMITLLAGVYIGYACQKGIDTDILLALLMVGNALLIISTVKNDK